jgi:CRISPR-associated protein Cmr6
VINRQNNNSLADQVPMLFRAQVDGRCQLHFIGNKEEKPHVQVWTNEWTNATAPGAPRMADDVQTRTFQISWRFVTNGGQDDGVIRPVIGAQGWPYFPGSSMKGAFRRACTPEQADLYCGRKLHGDYTPGILRFHGGYPTTTKWHEHLIDVIHPQQDWQVKSSQRAGRAFAGISLYRPELRFGISSTQFLTDSDWETIWQIWEVALGKGIGSRVSAGYGQPAKQSLATMHSVKLKGQGLSSKLLNGKPEFRPNMFKSTLRGHTLRILSGLTDAATAEQLTEELWGGLGKKGAKDGATVGLVGTAFNYDDLVMGRAGTQQRSQDIYKVSGTLALLLMQDKRDEKAIKGLSARVRGLVMFAMLLGGFGKSWRRADHSLFMPEYVTENTPIGCHWNFDLSTNPELIIPTSMDNDLRTIGIFIDQIYSAFKQWVSRKEKLAIPIQPYWRESWHPSNVQVWARLADDQEDSTAVKWFHQPYIQAQFHKGRQIMAAQSIKNSSITGEINKIGRIWHRMYPHYKRKDVNSPLIQTRGFIELLTIFPDGTDESSAFLAFLGKSRGEKPFQKVWPLL